VAVAAVVAAAADAAVVVGGVVVDAEDPEEVVAVDVAKGEAMVAVETVGAVDAGASRPHVRVPSSSRTSLPSIAWRRW
jgi:hypothetical protein